MNNRSYDVQTMTCGHTMHWPVENVGVPVAGVDGDAQRVLDRRIRPCNACLVINGMVSDLDANLWWERRGYEHRGNK